MHVFITGATGYIGSAVSRALIAQGHQVSGLARSDEAAAKLQAAGIAARRGELADAAALAQAAREADAVIHAAATNDAAMAETDRLSVAALAEALAGSGKPFIYTSGVFVLGSPGDRVADESTPLAPVALVAWRPAVEQAALATPGARPVVIRPAMVYGRGGGGPAMFVDQARAGVVRVIDGGENRWSFVHVDDLADLYVRTLAAEPGTLLYAASGPAYRVRQLAAAAVAAAGGGRVEPWPLAEARQALGPLADALLVDQQVSGELARRLLGWAPSGPDVLEDVAHGSYAQAPAASA